LIEQWIAEETSPIREVELIQQRLNVDAQLAQIDQAARTWRPSNEPHHVDAKSPRTGAACRGRRSRRGRPWRDRLAARQAPRLRVALTGADRDSG
jgi:hypothetical protein